MGATGDGVYTLPVEIGKRSRFVGIETTGDLAFDAEHVEVLGLVRDRGAQRGYCGIELVRHQRLGEGGFCVAADPALIGPHQTFAQTRPALGVVRLERQSPAEGRGGTDRNPDRNGPCRTGCQGWVGRRGAAYCAIEGA